MTVLSVKKSTTSNGDTYDVMTDLDPQALSLAGTAIYKAWVDFAMGRISLGGKTLMHPTGRYASSIRYSETKAAGGGASKVAIMSLETKQNPEAHILEVGHDEFDMKTLFNRGTIFAMHRGAQGDYGSAGYGAPRRNMKLFDQLGSKKGVERRKNIWASIRAEGSSGYARVGDTGWVIPPMPAYAPAQHLVDLFQSGDLHGV